MWRHSLTASGLLLALASSAQAGQNRQPAAESVLTALDRYFETYRLALGELVAQERMVQRTSGMRSLAITREIISDVAFIDLPGDAGWLGFRDARRVSGRDVARAGPSLIEALTLGGATGHERARALLAASAKYNLGAPRSTNLPNLPLELLHRRNRGQYKVIVEHRDHVRGHETAVLLLEEVRQPSIVRNPDGGDILTTVRAWIEPDSGRLWRAHVRMVDARVKVSNKFIAQPATLDVRFAEHATLGLLVPDRMDEEFYAAERGHGTSEARYTNYRRFSTGARIVPPESGR